LPGSIPLSAIWVSLYGTNGAEIGGVIAQTYASPASGGWYTVDVPLSAMGGSNTTISGVVLQEQRGIAEPAFYLDEVSFTGS
jgi:hypothetical protein